MTAADFLALLPWLVLTAATVIVMVAIGARRDHRLIALLTAAGLGAAALAVPLAAITAPHDVTDLFRVDGFALFALMLVVLAAGAVTALAYSYFVARRERCEEFYVLLLAGTLGAAVLVASRHFAPLLLGFELLSVALFAMVAYRVTRARPLEAGVKYLILAGLSTGLLLFGIALIYVQTGGLGFAELREPARGVSGGPYLTLGATLVLAGLAFKLSLVPFHLWTPDVYEGAPAPAAAFLATVSKGAILVVLLRWLLESGAYRYGEVLDVLALAGIVSMLAGNLLALMQNNVKRLLAYSSIGHMGYLMIPLVAGGALAVETIGYYLAAYFVMTLGAFGVVALHSAARGGDDDADDLEAYRGLFWQRPWLAGAFTAMLLALAGMPLTAGFVAKFYLFAAGADARLWLMLAALVIGSAIGLVYYLRVITAMLATDEAGTASAPNGNALAGRVTVAALTVVLIVLGIFPAPLLTAIQSTAEGLMP